MGFARYFVLRHDDEWLVALEGRAMARHKSQAQAIDSAIVMANLMGAMRHDADVMVEEHPGGPLRLAWSYGEDRSPRTPVKVLHLVPSHSHVKRVQLDRKEKQVS